MYRWGVPKHKMRVSALIHETSWHSIEMLQEFEKDTYNRFCARVPGTSTFNHGFDEGGILPQTLPFAFKDWQEYRDYLLMHIVKPEYHELFRKRWAKQKGEDWYRLHVKEVILNDIDGTKNQNHNITIRTKSRLGGKYKDKERERFEEYMKGKKHD
jgi:predicted phosphoadenosine phosphosulfate sulfurtransferase